MNTKTRIATLALAAMLLGSNAWADHGNRGSRAQYDYAKVLSAEPIINYVTVTTPVRECWEEMQYYTVDRGRDARGGGALLGAVIGGVIGHQFGSGRGNDAATVAGTLIGAAVGGLLGSQIGGGTGNKIAIGAGVLAGGLLGNHIGQSLSCQEQQRHGATAQNALEYERTGTTASWNNPDSGNAGTITPTRTYQRSDGQYCREFTQTISVEGDLEEARGTACRQEDGTWRIIS